MNCVLVIGKVSVPIARAVEDALGDRINDGLVVTNAVIRQTPRLAARGRRRASFAEAGNLEAASKALKILRAKDAEETLVSVSDLRAVLSA